MHDFNFGRLITDDKHLYLTFNNNIIVDEYDLLAISDDINNEDDRDKLFQFLDLLVPQNNKTYWCLRGDVRMMQTYWENRCEDGVSKEDIDEKLFNVRQSKPECDFDYSYSLFFANIESIVKKYNMKNYE